ncbi:hypothetical protein BK140_31395 [Paenibacillus macerans]|nr:hypothetical protein BK140_31395 [Paenibacillus macerans]
MTVTDLWESRYNGESRTGAVDDQAGNRADGTMPEPIHISLCRGPYDKTIAPHYAHGMIKAIHNWEALPMGSHYMDRAIFKNGGGAPIAR